METNAKITGLGSVFIAIGRMREVLNSEEVLKEAAIKFQANLRKNISEQTYGDFGNPHSAKWAEFKRKKGANPGMYWKYLGTLFKAIRYIRLKKGKYWAGVQSDTKGSKGRGNPKEYGLILEQGGNSYNPEKARPLIHNTAEDFKEEWNALIKNEKNKLKVIWK